MSVPAITEEEGKNVRELSWSRPGLVHEVQYGPPLTQRTDNREMDRGHIFKGLVEGHGLPVGPSSSAALPVTIPAGVVPLQPLSYALSYASIDARGISS